MHGDNTNCNIPAGKEQNTVRGQMNRCSVHMCSSPRKRLFGQGILNVKEILISGQEEGLSRRSRTTDLQIREQPILRKMLLFLPGERSRLAGNVNCTVRFRCQERDFRFSATSFRPQSTSGRPPTKSMTTPRWAPHGKANNRRKLSSLNLSFPLLLFPARNIFRSLNCSP